MKNRKIYAIIFGIFALGMVTGATSYAFFSYSRVGNTTNTITSGDIEFTYKEGESAGLANAFPVADSVGAKDTTEEYTFMVNMKSSSASTKMNYNVYLLDANDDENTNYFTNEQIKFALVKNGTYVADTSSELGVKLSEISGFSEGAKTGEGIVLEDQEILAGVTDEYKLRIWISNDVNYSNTVDGQDEQTSFGKYNGYKYSLKVKVTSGVALVEAGTIKNLKVDKLTITADLSDSNGLNAYAVTQSETAPENDSTEWIDLTTTAKSNVVRTSTVTKKTIEYMVKKNGNYYLHVKNGNNEITTKTFTTNATGENAVDKIVGLAETNTNELRIDEHAATGQQTFATKEYRYWGTTPNNYVWFNNELWRIIGAMDVENESGTFEKRLKIIRANPIQNYSWDSSDENVNKGYGINEWSQADSMILLNSGAYYNRTTGNCYMGNKNNLVFCDFSENSRTPGLTSEAKEMIGNAKWYLGAGPSSYSTLTSLDFYGYERGNALGKQCTSDNISCTDTVERKPYWIGQIGLMYPSDFGYSANMLSCSSTTLASYNTSCRDTTWLYNNAVNQWILSPISFSTAANSVFAITQSGNLNVYEAYSMFNFSPTTYLLPSIKILDGDGSETRPFVLSK